MRTSIPFRPWRIAVVPLLFASCIVPKIQKTDDFPAESSVQTLSIDAKQRVFLFAKIPDPHPTSDSPGTTTTIAALSYASLRDLSNFRTLRGRYDPPETFRS
jgi:hypothetical protein